MSQKKSSLFCAKTCAILPRKLRSTPSSPSLRIESLDLAVIVFDIEDTFGIQIPYNANEEMQDFATVGSVVDRVKAVLAGSQAANPAA